jgi:hypothetical protein
MRYWPTASADAPHEMETTGNKNAGRGNQPVPDRQRQLYETAFYFGWAMIRKRPQ